MEQTTGWAKVFGTSKPSFSAESFNTRHASFQPPVLNSYTPPASNILPTTTPTVSSIESSDLLFERVDLFSVCQALELIVQQASNPPSSDSSSTSNTDSNPPHVYESSTDSYKVADSMVVQNDQVVNPGLPGAIARPWSELLSQISKQEIKKDTILIRKCSLADQENCKTSHFGKLIRLLPASFKTISICDCIISETAIASLCYGLLGSNHIRSLVLKHNTLGSDRIKGIATGLATNKILTSLEISFSDSIQLTLPYISSSLDDNNVITSLTLNNDRLTDVSSLTNGLKRLSSITALDLSSNYLDRTQASNIAEMLLVNYSLAYLNLSSNVFGDHGAQLIALALERNRGLTNLKFDSCSLNDLGVSALAKALKYNNTLVELSLAGNFVTDLSASAFIEAFQVHQNKTLQVLILEGPTDHAMNNIKQYLDYNASKTTEIPNKQINYTLFPPAGAARPLNLSTTENQSILTTITHLSWNSDYQASPKLLFDAFSPAMLRIVYLDLSKSGVTKVPSCISNLVHLKVLDLRSNNLVLLCTEISLCTQLETLKLSDNLLESLPCELCILKKLNEVHLYGNPLNLIPNISMLIDGELKGPTLDTSLPDMNFYRFHHVSFQQTKLYSYLKELYDTQSQEADWNFGSLVVLGSERSGKSSLINHLASLSLKKLKTYESKYGLFKTSYNVKQIQRPTSTPADLRHHPTHTFLKESPFEVSENANSSESNKNCIAMADLLLFNDDGSSTGGLLSRSGSKGSVSRSSVSSPTSYKDSSNIPPNMQPYQYMCHEFNGKDCFQPSHTYLLFKQGCTYLVVFSLADYPNNKQQIEYWIKTIICRSGSFCSTILVGTHWETKFGNNKSQMKECLNALKTEYKDFVHDVHFVDSKSKTDRIWKYFMPLMSSIVTNSKKSVGLGSKVPINYTRALSQLLHLRDHLDCSLTTYRAFEGHMSASGIRPNQMENLMSHLNKMGMIRYWPNERKLSDVVFVDPEFLYSCLSEIVGSHFGLIKSQLSGIQAGTITRKQIEAFWSEASSRSSQPSSDDPHSKEYFPFHRSNVKPKLRPTILRLGESFEFLAIDYTHVDERITFPHLLSHNTVDLSSYWTTTCSPGMKMFERVYLFPFLPKGFIAKLTTRFLQMNQVLEIAAVWGKGIILRPSNRNKEVAKIELSECAQTATSPASCTLSVSVMMPQESPLLKKLLDAVNSFLESWFDLVEPKVFMRIRLENGMDDVIAQEEIIKRIAQNQDTYISSTGNYVVQLDSIAPELIQKTSDRRSDLSVKLLSNNNSNERVAIGKGDLGYLIKTNADALPNDALTGHILIKQAELVTDLGDENPHRSAALSASLIAFSKSASEVNQLKLLQHTNLIKFLGIHHVPHLSLVTEYFESVNLRDFVRSNPESSWTIKIKILLEVAFAIEHLHRQTPALVHGNIKPGNVLISVDEASNQATDPAFIKVKTSDYAVYPILQKLNGDYLPTPHWQWQAPEVFSGGDMTSKSDVYSFGNLIWYLWKCHDQTLDTIEESEESANRPYSAYEKSYGHDSHLQYAVLRRILRPGIPVDNSLKQGSISLESLLRQCWKSNPEERPDFSSIIKKLIHIAELTRKVNETSEEVSKPRIRSVYDVSMKQLQDDKNWHLLASYCFKQESCTITSVIPMPINISSEMVSDTTNATPLVPVPISIIASLPVSTLLLGFSKNFLRYLDLKSGKTSVDINLLKEDDSKRPLIVVSSAADAKKAGRVNSRQTGRSPPPMLSPMALNASTSTSTTTTSSSRTNQRVIGSFYVEKYVWTFAEDKTLTIFQGSSIVSRVAIGKHPTCLTRCGDFAYVGCGEGFILELDLTRIPNPNATTIDDYLLRTMDVQGNPVYTILVDDSTLWVGSQGDIYLLDRLSSHKYSSWNAHTDRVTAILRPSGTNTVWTASDDRSIKVWSIRSFGSPIVLSNPSQPDKILKHHTSRIKYMISCGDSVISTAGENSAVWDTKTGVVAKVLPHKGFSSSMALIDRSTFITVSSSYDQATALNDNYIQVWHNSPNPTNQL